MALAPGRRRVRAGRSGLGVLGFGVWYLAFGSWRLSYFTHLECSVPCGADVYDPRVEQHLCACGAPLLARYDLESARAWSRESLAAREPNMWRYRELMPLLDGQEPITLGEGWTPLIHAKRLGAAVIRSVGFHGLLQTRCT